MAKIATISNFSNMDDTGAYYLEGMVARKINGKSILSPGFYSRFILSEDDTGFSGLGTIRQGSAFLHIANDDGNGVIIDSANDLYDLDITSGSEGTAIGKFHTTASSSTPNPDVQPLSFCDLAVTKNENVIYSTQYALGIGQRGTVKTGSDTTTILDTDLRNFATLGISTTVGSNKVYNFNNEEEYNITAVGNGAATNDKLTVDAGTSNTAGDIFMAFSDIGANNGATYWDFFATTAYPHFVGQVTVPNFKRQIELFDTDYLVGNGNFLAALNVNETTWNDNFKQLPDQTQFECMGRNQTRMLVGASRKGQGVLLLWDGYSDGWLAIEELEQLPTCIKPYSGGWLVLIGGGLYFSDGYSTKLISTIPDVDDLDADLGTFYNSMIVTGDRVIISMAPNGVDRAKSGTWVYEFGSGWTITPYYNGVAREMTGLTSGAVFAASDYPTNFTNRYNYSSFSGGEGVATSCLNQLADRTGINYSAMFYINLPKKMNVSQIKLNIAPQYDSSVGEAYGTLTSSVAVADGNEALWRDASLTTGSTTTTLKNTTGGNAWQSGTVKSQIRITEGDAAGERSYITSIASAGTSSETLTISPALTFAPLTGSNFNINALQLADTHTFTSGTVPDEMPFTVEGFYSDKLIFEVVFNSSGGTTVDIHSIDIYGE